MDPRTRLLEFKKQLGLDAPSPVPAVEDDEHGQQAVAPTDDAEVDGKEKERRKAVKEEHAREQLRRLSFGGVPDAPSHIRPLVWSRLLGLPDPEQALDEYRAFLSSIAARLLSYPEPSSAPGESIKEDRVLREIDRDVVRTFGGLAWFSAPCSAEAGEGDAVWERLVMLDQADSAAPTPTSAATEHVEEQRIKSPPPVLSLVPPGDNGDGPQTVDVPPTPVSPLQPSSAAFPASLPGSPRPPQEREPRTAPKSRRDLLLRPLFTYAVLNTGLSYVQGMNSLLGVFFYVFLSASPVTEQTQHDKEELAEALAFYAFGKVVSQLQDLYSPSLDGTLSPPTSASTGARPHSPAPTGLGETLTRFSALLNWLDPAAALALNKKGLDPALFVFRWLTTAFATSLALPDVFRTWDRLLLVYPTDPAARPPESLSPILGHLLDLSLAMVLIKRPLVVSPYSDFSKVMAALQDPQVEGRDVDRLLAIAWDIRGRRLRPSAAKPKPRVAAAPDAPATPEKEGVTTGLVRAASWKNAAGAAAALKTRLWGAASSTAGVIRDAADYELDDGASEASSAAGGEKEHHGTNREAPKKLLPTIAEADTPRDRTPPPPPPKGEEKDKEADEKSSSSGDVKYSSDEDEEEGVTLAELRDKAASAWTSWTTKIAASDTAAVLAKQRSNMAASAMVGTEQLSRSATRIIRGRGVDAAAALSKTATNARAQAMLVSEGAPDRIAKIRESVSHAGGQLFAGADDGKGVRRPPSPTTEPFSPPRWGDSPGMSRRPVSPLPFGSANPNGSNGRPVSPEMPRSPVPKALLLSSSARPAEPTTSEDGGSPPDSRRSSLQLSTGPSGGGHHHRSPSMTKSASNPFDLVIPPLGLARSPSGRLGHGRTASNATATQSPTEKGMGAAGHARSASAAPFSSPIAAHARAAEDEPISSPTTGTSRLKRSFARKPTLEDPDVQTVSARPAVGGRGWTLSDAPVKAAPIEESGATVVEEPTSSQPGSARPPPGMFGAMSAPTDDDDAYASPHSGSGGSDNSLRRSRRAGHRSTPSTTVDSSEHSRFSSEHLSEEAKRSVNSFLAGEGGGSEGSVGSGRRLVRSTKVSSSGRNLHGRTPSAVARTPDWDEGGILESYGESK